MDKPRISGWGYAYATVTNVGDLLELAKWCTEHRIDAVAPLDLDGDQVCIELVDTDDAYLIECGDHMGDDVRYDVILPTHEHEDEDVLVCDKCGQADPTSTYFLYNARYLCRLCYSKQAPNNREEALEDELDRQRVMLDRERGGATLRQWWNTGDGE